MTPMTATLPMDIIAFDFAVMKVTTTRGHMYILVIVDVATRFVILEAMKTRTAEETATTLLRVFSLFGFPRVVQHD